MIDPTSKGEAIAQLLQEISNYDFRDDQGYKLINCPFFHIDSITWRKAIAEIESYKFKDPLGHPLINCVHFIELKKLIGEIDNG